MKLYGLYSEKHRKLLGVNTFATVDGDVVFKLRLDCDRFSIYPWVSTSMEIALNVAENPNVHHYNSEYASPVWNEKTMGKISVVDLEGDWV